MFGLYDNFKVHSAFIMERLLPSIEFYTFLTVKHSWVAFLTLWASKTFWNLPIAVARQNYSYLIGRGLGTGLSSDIVLMVVYCSSLSKRKNVLKKERFYTFLFGYLIIPSTKVTKNKLSHVCLVWFSQKKKKKKNGKHVS